MFRTEYGFRMEYGSVRQGRTEFNSVQTEYGNHVVVFPQLSPTVFEHWVGHTESDRALYGNYHTE